MADIVFFTSILLIVYTYIGYPLVMVILALILRRGVDLGDMEPSVTVIIPVHNEEHQIRAKLENCLSFAYPRDKLEIVVASDASTDRTEEIVKELDSGQIKFVDLPFRGGKVVAQNHAVRECQSDIIIFTDVAITTRPDCVQLIVQNFNDPQIGVVSCRDVIIGGDGRQRGEKSYILYDMMVRKYASQVGSIIGVTGGFYAVRREIARGGWNPAFPPDFYVAIRCIKRGLRVVEDPRVKAYYRAAAKEWDELQRKVRTISRGMQALFAESNRSLLNPFKYGIVSLELISHKLFRWMTPFFLIALFLSNMLIVRESAVALVTFLPQLALSILAPLSFVVPDHTRKSLIFKLANYFAIAMIAILKSWGEVLLGRQYVMWQPTKR